MALKFLKINNVFQCYILSDSNRLSVVETKIEGKRGIQNKRRPFWIISGIKIPSFELGFDQNLTSDSLDSSFMNTFFSNLNPSRTDHIFPIILDEYFVQYVQL
jgi:hypothetical protein